MPGYIHIAPDRLLGAADAILEALECQDGGDSHLSIAGDGRPARRDRPIDQFKNVELVEAMSMLIRMGFAVPDAAPP